MKYYLNLFSPETYEAFGRSDRCISGFKFRHQAVAQRVRPGDRFLCYMTKLSRWVGLLEVRDGPFRDETPIYFEADDPFVVRFHVEPLIWLPLDKTIPIHEDRIWNALSFTQGLPKNSSNWTGKVRGSLSRVTADDARVLETALRAQVDQGESFPVDPEAFQRLLTRRVRRADRDVSVSVPDESSTLDDVSEVTENRESIKIQALLAEIGSRMGMQIWIPRNDRVRVLAEWRGEHPEPLERLPLNYDEVTLRTIEQIDILWLRGRAIKRAFEVEHTTSIYSGLLRMADLLALQPNMDIRLHIAAPSTRRERVLHELLRPVFSLLERGPLSELCSYLPYESIREIATQEHLTHLSDTVLEEYEEIADS